MDHSELFWNAGIEELKRGYIRQGEQVICLLDGQRFEQGIIYQDQGVFYDAERYMRLHIERTYGSVFDYLIGLDKKLTGLTDHQNRLLQLFYQGMGDADIQKETGIGSASTIRNHRFGLKEKERQAKVFLTLMELLKEKDRHAPAIVEVPIGARMVDERYNITEDEKQKVLTKYFPNGTDGRLKTFKMQEKHKLIVLREIAGRFMKGQIYHEKDINAILQEVYDDYVTVRRYMIEYSLLDRKPDGSEYWLKES
ncbi:MULTISPECIES: DUF2087 domain-containing protein [unclassified Paenibacillus]|uniref:DUF2087 domain-containing protein n=1 Tax=unclassified Paenibacillus TaxID=185978 RepID=UPI0013EDF75B|nr:MULTISPECIES: DUF2087 domain-containing protein [unclassified Paenibacillus]KAF6576717.1 DUF2087 domain-containing protein [Paenibacillus sp. EKM206P]KAF6591149.1 DUF2087 domain-containing protein [Paenibacillus sp. EKM205P]